MTNWPEGWRRVRRVAWVVWFLGVAMYMPWSVARTWQVLHEIGAEEYATRPSEALLNTLVQDSVNAQFIRQLWIHLGQADYWFYLVLLGVVLPPIAYYTARGLMRALLRLVRWLRAGFTAPSESR